MWWLALALTTAQDLQSANDRSTEEWRAIRTREDWERFRDARIRALRESLGRWPDPPADLKARVTRELTGTGHRVENLVFESRPGLLVTANLYLPEPLRASMPGILICHSHHAAKTQGELQDMGVRWARAGCAVLVMDQLGHGERRTHPFVDAASYPGSWRVGRQDYYFRYVIGMQLHAIGESLVGWMAWDLMRGVDLLLARPGVDPKRIALLGAVAGGGDPAAVTAALDPRIAAVVPFNFGGPQPETKYPLPEGAERTFNYAGGGSWESTRNLRNSARDGFLPWVIVGSVAPRGLVYAHEFSWDRDRDPVWKRFETIWGFYGSDRLSAAHGRGLLSGKSPEATHCTNIGAEHRAHIDPAFEKWFSIPPPGEPSERRPAAELASLTEKPRPLLEVLAGFCPAPPPADRGELRRRWSALLGPVEPTEAVPAHFLGPEGRVPAIVAIGRGDFQKRRSDDIAALRKAGFAVCIFDPGGFEGSRGRTGEGTYRSSTALMLGEPLIGRQLRALRGVLRFVRTRADPVALWGDSFAPPNDKVAAPLDVGESFPHAEPVGDVLALLGALYEDDIRAVYTWGGVKGYASLLDSPYVYVPHDVLVPGAVAAGDLGALLPARAAREGSVDAMNRRLDPAQSPRPAAWLVDALKR